MKLVDSYKEAFTRYVDFSGVTDRVGYWFFVLAKFIVAIVISSYGFILALITILRNGNKIKQLDIDLDIHTGFKIKTFFFKEK